MSTKLVDRPLLRPQGTGSGGTHRIGFVFCCRTLHGFVAHHPQTQHAVAHRAHVDVQIFADARDKLSKVSQFHSTPSAKALCGISSI